MPRTLKATAVLFAEPSVTSIPNDSSHSIVSKQYPSCPKPIAIVERKIKAAEEKIAPVLNKVSKVLTPFARIHSTISKIGAVIVRKLRIQCLIPKLYRPFEPVFRYTKCLLGINSNKNMKLMTPSVATICQNPTEERMLITHSRGLPNLDSMIAGKISTIDDCFSDIEKVLYGARVKVKIVDDEPCENPNYKNICQEAIEQNRVLFEANCQSQR